MYETSKEETRRLTQGRSVNGREKKSRDGNAQPETEALQEQQESVGARA